MDNKRSRQQLRKEYKKKRQELGAELRQVYSRQISRNLDRYFQQDRYDMVFAYYPLGCEASVLPFIEELWGKQVRTAFPKVVGEELVFYEVEQFSQLEEGAFHIMEPDPEQTKQVYPVPGTQKDSSAGSMTENRQTGIYKNERVLPDGTERILVLTPGLVFDRQGNRMGYGKGYYDRFFEAVPDSHKAGIAFECQIADRLETERWDVKLDAVITEKEIYL